MTYRHEYQIWQDELAGRKTSLPGHIIAAIVGCVLAALLIVVERVL
ncbi:hypothetical protein [Devosia sp.]